MDELYNSRHKIESIPELERATEANKIDFGQDPLQNRNQKQPATRRDTLSTMSAVYDPLGCVAPSSGKETALRIVPLATSMG